MDVLAPTTMKNAAKCDTSCELQNPVSHQIFERNLRFLRGACLLECLFIPTNPPKLALAWGLASVVSVMLVLRHWRKETRLDDKLFRFLTESRLGTENTNASSRFHSSVWGTGMTWRNFTTQVMPGNLVLKRVVVLHKNSRSNLQSSKITRWI